MVGIPPEVLKWEMKTIFHESGIKEHPQQEERWEFVRNLDKRINDRSVLLERCIGKNKYRALKVVSKKSMEVAGVDFGEELKAVCSLALPVVRFHTIL
jgi:hypothetical protein